MRKEYKEKRLLKIKPIIDKEINSDITQYKEPKSRTLLRWMEIINVNLKCKQDHIANGNEMASLFIKLKKYFIVEKKTHYIPIGDDINDLAKKSKRYYLIKTK